MDKDFEWGYREAVAGDIGSKVEVGITQSEWQERELVAVLPADMTVRFVCRGGAKPSEPMTWKHSRVRYRLPYAERQLNCGIGIGDYVKVLRVPGGHEDGWEDEPVSSMGASVGKVFEVLESNPEGGFFLQDDHWYPYFVLERAEKPVVEGPKPKVRTVADLADGELICTDRGRWFQIALSGDYGNDPWNEPHKDCGWVAWGLCHGGCRRAYLLHAPSPELSSIHKLVFPVGSPGERYRVDWVFAGAGEWRAVVSANGDYKVFCLSDLRVIPE